MLFWKSFWFEHIIIPEAYLTTIITKPSFVSRNKTSRKLPASECSAAPLSAPETYSPLYYCSAKLRSRRSAISLRTIHVALIIWLPTFLAIDKAGRWMGIYNFRINCTPRYIAGVIYGIKPQFNLFRYLQLSIDINLVAELKGNRLDIY